MSYWFPDDNNEILTSVQYEVRNDVIGYLFINPAERYRTNARFVEVYTELYERIGEAFINSFYLKNLYPIYNLLAAYFRFTTNPSGQLPLFDGGQSIRDFYSGAWRDFYYPEVQKISEDGVCAVNLIKSVVYYNEPSGLNAHEEVLARLKEKYCMVREKLVFPEFLIQERFEEEERKKFGLPTRCL